MSPSYFTEPSERLLTTTEEKVDSLMLTWSQGSLLPDIMQTFLLTINHGSSSHVIPLNESHYNFTAPEGAPPCEVYNFSVTANYIGATYIGAGCSVPGILNNKMLPSLPDIDRLESTITYRLLQQSEEFIFNISFEVSYHNSLIPRHLSHARKESGE